MRSLALNATEPIFSAELVDIDEASQGRQSARVVEVLHRGEGPPVVSHLGQKAKSLGHGQVSISRDKDAFRYYINAAAGRETQDELQELAQWHPTAGYAVSEGRIAETKVETKPITIKIEKENLSLAPTVSCAVSQVKSSTKRARVEEPEDHAVKLEHDIVPAIVEPLQSDKLRISVLEAEVSSLRKQIVVNQQDHAAHHPRAATGLADDAAGLH
ncbi:hypothetical protein B0H14DRAFT_3879996 [Mycena olivaceomarginata]|nr:hypothetical protein B0H14DRAFT_3879996 [Mycena olivaceomarginata]